MTIFDSIKYPRVYEDMTDGEYDLLPSEIKAHWELVYGRGEIMPTYDTAVNKLQSLVDNYNTDNCEIRTYVYL